MILFDEVQEGIERKLLEFETMNNQTDRQNAKLTLPVPGPKEAAPGAPSCPPRTFQVRLLKGEPVHIHTNEMKEINHSIPIDIDL